MQAKVRGGNMKAANPQQVIFELKKKVITALNKLADRDTYQRGVDELEKTVENLTPDKISCFLSCILDTDSEQKSAVRKECIRLMATLAKFHQGLVGPYIGKMVSSVVKRLKDQDSVVRDACIETMGVLASYGVFVTLVKPLFEAIGDQNKYVQSGAALCLARVIDSSTEVPVAIIQRMLTRTIKLLNNSHFTAKPAVIELNRSIILAGGATTKSLLVSAMTSFQDALKNNDWTTRKAASVALIEIAATGEKFLGPLKASCVRSLESCRFDKVKPVRDSVILALQYWKGVPGADDSPQLSETGSSLKGELSFNGGARDNSQLLNTKMKDTASNKYVTDLEKKKVTFSRKTIQDNWHIQESPMVSKFNLDNEESEGSCCITKTQVTQEGIPIMEDKEVSSSSFLAEEKQFSTVTVSSSHQVNHEFSAQIVNEMACVRKQLSDIENKQSLLIDQLQAFSTGIMNSFTVLQSKVLSLEYAVEAIAQNVVLHSDISNSNFAKQNSILSPRLSSCTSRNSTEMKIRLGRSTKREGIWSDIGTGRQTLIQTRKRCEEH